MKVVRAALLRHGKAVGHVAAEVWMLHLKEDVTEGYHETAAVGAHVVLADSNAGAGAEASPLMWVHSSGVTNEAFYKSMFCAMIVSSTPCA